MAHFVKKDGSEVLVVETRPSYGEIKGVLHDVELDSDSIRLTWRVKIVVEFTQEDMMDQGGIEWLRVGSFVRIRQ